MIDKIKDLADNILGVRQDLTDLANPTIENVVIGPLDKLRSFGPIPLNSKKVANFMLNELNALRNRYKDAFNTLSLEYSDFCDPKKLAVLIGLRDLGWFSTKDLVGYLEQNINDTIRDSESRREVSTDTCW